MYLLNADSMVACAHAGTASPTQTDPRVKVDGSPVVTLASPYAISGCTLAPGPCATGTWVAGAGRVKASGQPVVLMTSSSTSAPNNLPLQAIKTQTRVTGQ